MKAVSLVVVAGLALTGLSACGAGEPQTKASGDEATLAIPDLNTKSATARQEWIDGVHEYDLGRVDNAYEHFKRAAAADPNMMLAEAYAGLAMIQLGNIETTAAHFKRAGELAKTGTAAEKLIASSLQKTLEGNNEGAVADALQLVKLEPNEARWWTDILSGSYDAMTKTVEARAARDKALELAPGWAGTWLYQSFTYAALEPRDLVKAEQTARKGIELEPNENTSWDALGDALRAQGKLEEAAQAYTKCAELDPTQADGLQQRGHVQSFLGRFTEARADYDAAIPLATPARKFSLSIYRPFVNLHEANAKAAVEELEQLYASVDESKAPDPVGAKQSILIQGILPVVFYKRMIPEAESAVARFVQLTEQQIQSVKTETFQRTGRANIAIAQGRLALAKGDYAGAQKKAEEAITLRGGDRNSADNRAARMLLGSIAHAQGNYAEALREFEHGSPDNMLMVYLQAQSLEALGRTAEAQTLYEKVASNYFNSVEVAMLRGEALKKLKKPAA